jgi:hypothetical protein
MSAKLKYDSKMTLVYSRAKRALSSISIDRAGKKRSRQRACIQADPAAASNSQHAHSVYITSEYSISQCMRAKTQAFHLRAQPLQKSFFFLDNALFSYQPGKDSYPFSMYVVEEDLF